MSVICVLLPPRSLFATSSAFRAHIITSQTALALPADRLVAASPSSCAQKSAARVRKALTPARCERLLWERKARLRGGLRLGVTAAPPWFHRCAFAQVPERHRHRFAVRKLRNQPQFAPHSRDIAGQRREQQISAPLDAGHVFLFHA